MEEHILMIDDMPLAIRLSDAMPDNAFAMYQAHQTAIWGIMRIQGTYSRNGQMYQFDVLYDYIKNKVIQNLLDQSQ